MKNISIAALIMGLGIAWSAQAVDAEAGKELTPEQRQQRTALIQKYDTNKDGVLDKSEFKQINKDDKKALAKLGGVGTAKKAAKTKEPAEKAKDAQKEKETKVENAKEEQKAKEPKTEKAVSDSTKGGKGKGKK